MVKRIHYCCSGGTVLPCYIKVISVDNNCNNWGVLANRKVYAKRQYLWRLDFTSFLPCSKRHNKKECNIRVSTCASGKRVDDMSKNFLFSKELMFHDMKYFNIKGFHLFLRSRQMDVECLE